MNVIGEMIGQGNTAEIYNYGEDCILKLYRTAMPEHVCRDEFRYTLIAFQTTSKAPEPVEIISVNGRIGAVYKKFSGKTMLKLMLASLWKIGHYAEILANCHKEIQKPIDGNIPMVKEKLRRDIESVEMLSEAEKLLIYRDLSGLPDGNSLCHFDFHPDNIMLHESQYCVIDWMTACKGDKLADAARTGIILKFSQIPRAPAIVNLIAGAVKKSVYHKYIEYYLETTGAITEDIERWELAVAAARLREWIPEKEKQQLLTFIRRRMGTISCEVRH